LRFPVQAASAVMTMSMSKTRGDEKKAPFSFLPCGIWKYVAVASFRFHYVFNAPVSEPALKVWDQWKLIQVPMAKAQNGVFHVSASPWQSPSALPP
jgi:hypothetical protein